QTWLWQSTRFLELPLGVFGVALGTVILPALSRHHVGTDHAGFSRAMDWGLRLTWLIALPATLALLVLAGPLVITLFENGHYTAFDAQMTTLSTMALSLGLPAYALVKILLPAFYARQDTRTPVRAGVAALVTNMLFNGLFIVLLFELMAPPPLHRVGWLEGIAQVPGLHVALAIASSLSSYVNFLLLWHWLKRSGVYQREPGWARHWLRLALACAVMVLVLVLGRWLWPHWSGVPILTRVWHLAVLVLAGGMSYVGTLLVAGLRLRDLRGACPPGRRLGRAARPLYSGDDETFQGCHRPLPGAARQRGRGRRVRWPAPRPPGLAGPGARTCAGAGVHPDGGELRAAATCVLLARTGAAPVQRARQAARLCRRRHGTRLAAALQPGADHDVGRGLRAARAGRTAGGA